MTKRRAFTPLIATAAALALAAPALADNVSVTLTGSGGTRQFSVEDMSGNPLTALDLTSSSQPFKVHVQDNAFLPSAGQGNYSVSATMSNLYLKTGASTYNYAVKVPSSDLSVGFGSNPLTATGLSLVDLPTLNLTGTLSCNPLNLQTLSDQLGLGSIASLLSGVLTQLTNLCTAITTAGSGAVSAAVNGAQQTVSPVLSSLTDLPTALGGATGGTFTNPSFAAGTVGEGDTAGATGAPSATSVSLMQGTQGLTSGLATAIKNALNGASALVAGSGTALTTTQAVTTGLTTAGTTVDNALAQLLQTLSSSQAVSAINSALSLASFATPVLSDIRAVTGSYYSVPVLQASARTPVAGTYGGTMTVTFVQS
jgi:hypothetical protein